MIIRFFYKFFHVYALSGGRYVAEGAESSLLGSLIGGYVLASPHYVFGVDGMANAYDVERQCVAFLQLDVFRHLDAEAAGSDA